LTCGLENAELRVMKATTKKFQVLSTKNLAQVIGGDGTPIDSTHGSFLPVRNHKPV
jgi:bacteriocin-like protein